jgi:serine/threonine protein kinase
MVSSGRRYEIEAPLGKGGFGTVYRARFIGEGGFSKVVALKVLNENMADLDEVLARLRDEARLLGMLRHRAIVRADRLVRLANRWAVVMELVEGADLKRVVSETTVSPGAAVEIIGEVAGALHAAWHTTGPDGAPLHLIHRDIKPSNIVLTSYGEIKVLDFGIARADFGGREAETRAFGMGSLPYMAPERLDFRDTAAADVYALGVVFFELVTGRAFGRASANPERHTSHVDAALRFLVDQGLGSRDLLLFLGSLLAYDPDERPTARQLERMCVNLRRRFEDEPLRYWAEQAVPSIVEKTAKLPADGLTGSALVEQTEGTFAELPMGAPPAGSSGSFSQRVAGTDTGSTGAGSGSFRRPVAEVRSSSLASASGAFSRPVAGIGTGSTGTGTGERSAPIPAPPPPPTGSGVFPRPQREAEVEEPVVEPPSVELAEPGSSTMRWVVLGVLLLLLVLAVGVGVGVGVMKAQERSLPPPTTPAGQADPAPSVGPAAPPPLEPAPEPAVDPPGEPEEAPAEVDPAPVQPAAEPEGASPEPERAEQSAAAAPAPAPAPAEEVAPAPALEPEPEPEPAPAGKARVEVAGDAELVVLVGSAGSFALPATVPEGSYTIKATFPGREPVVAGRAAVHAGSLLTVRCSAGFTRCKAQ